MLSQDQRGDDTTHPVQPDEARDGEGSLNVEEVFADLSVEMSEEDLKYEDSLRAIMSDILEWAISFFGKAEPGNHPRNLFQPEDGQGTQ